MDTLSCIIVLYVRNSGLPKGRESYGDGVPIVLRGRESLLHGEVEQEKQCSGDVSYKLYKIMMYHNKS